MKIRKFVGILIILIIAVSFSGHTQQIKTKVFDVVVVVDYNNYTLPNNEDLLMQNKIKNITEQELGKLPDVNIRKITPRIPGQVAPEYIINVLASTHDDRFISFVTLFLQRSSVPEFFIAPKSIDAYKAWDNLRPNYILLAMHAGIPTGYCTKDKLEEYIKDDVNTFNKKVLQVERIAKQASDSTIDFLRRMEKIQKGK